MAGIVRKRDNEQGLSLHDSIPNQKEGTWKWFDEKGNLIKEEYYKNGEKTGEKEYVPSGIKKE